MPDKFLPQPNVNPYNRSKLGIYGNLGKGANADILFIETVLSIDELDSVTLISNIPGSETWDVRDLFQRDVDDDRVQEDIIPYFKDKTKIKYFSPITLILLPTENNKRSILKEIEYIEPYSLLDEQIEKIYENKDYYKLNIYKHSDPIANLEWNDRNCFLVAIDGQHRLSALKRWKSEPESNFNDWKIPAVILNILKVDPAGATINLLELVRKTFVYLNTKAERINSSRVILLNDESVDSICTQEIIQRSHNNDKLPIEQRTETTVPLIFFDWQGKVVKNQQFPGPASLKSVEEIHQWFKQYIFDEDDKVDQKKVVLCLGDLVPPLEAYGPKIALSHKDAIRIRDQFNKIVAEGIYFLLENFKPYKSYIKACRDLEKKSITRSDNASHAFMKLRFGTHNAPDDQRETVQAEFETLKRIFDEYKKDIDYTIRQDIGMRGIIYAFADLKKRIVDLEKKDIEWLSYSKIFTEAINELYDNKWFKSYDNLPANIKELLTHLIFDEAGNIINYKFQQAEDALGSLMIILITENFKRNNSFNINADRFEEIWGGCSNNLRKTYEKGLRRFYKGKLINEGWEGPISEFNNNVKTLAEEKSAQKIDALYKFITKIQ